MDASTEQVTPRWIRPKLWKQLTGMSNTEVYRRIESGQLRAVKVGRAVYIDAREIDAFFERAGVKAAA